VSRLGRFGGRRAIYWIVPAALVLANLVWLVAFGNGSRLREADLGRRLDRARRESTQSGERLAVREKLWVVATENQERLERLDRELFSTERSRFTDTVRELKNLSERAGLIPGTITYPRETLEEFELTRRSFVFSVEGSYAQLRTFLNLAELSTAFLVVEQISVSESPRGLGIRLRLSTLYSTAPGSEPAIASPTDGGAGAAPDAEPAAETNPPGDESEPEE